MPRLKKQTVSLGGFTLIVTGFPRSGTSMMMRMLKLAGIRVIADTFGNKPQHKHDPYGCLESEDIGHRIKKNKKSWTKNKAIKIVTPYSTWYPIDRPMKAIFMQRDLNEIVTSLLAMKSIWDEDIAESISTARGYLKYNDVPVLFLKYREVVNFPKTTAFLIQDFLDTKLDIDNMVVAVDRDARIKYKTDKKLKGYGVPDPIIRFDKEVYSDLKVDNYHTVRVAANEK